MPGRSLQLSEAGQQQARQALLMRNLTQKAIANELAIASWSTVNKFFNGKPVDRFIFQEICDALNLEWSDVVESSVSVVDREMGSNRDGESTPPTPPITLSPYPQPR
ncbi:helix-turn-helix transcriptional regulator, partial [Nodosilinea sp. LEGE 07088]|uniref:helix-turn-helix domain-containing protein n=1 Tax=Nodosilinea sp. LEGE 07088 TaxID=2777968 RepID=UPI00187DDB68